MKKLAAALVTAISTALAIAAAPVVFAPPAHAEACAAVHGRHITAGGCTDGAGNAVLLAPAYAGEASNHIRRKQSTTSTNGTTATDFGG